jgi:hypothetical protein
MTSVGKVSGTGRGPLDRSTLALLPVLKQVGARTSDFT